jgi:hypothetical protein
MQAQAVFTGEHLAAYASTLLDSRLRAQLAHPAGRRMQAPHPHAEGLSEMGVLQRAPLPEAPH